MENNARLKLGVVGGLGPLASAEFLKTIYQYTLSQQEQDAPVVLLKSDPTFPDRTTEFLNGTHELLHLRLIEELQCLLKMGYSRIVICCITMHYLLPLLNHELRKSVISLVDEIFTEVANMQQKQLLLCTQGTRELGIFQRHEKWEAVKELIIWPEEDDQRKIHEFIYQMKRNRNPATVIPALEMLLAKYRVPSFIAGCTEIHLISKNVAFAAGNPRNYACIDPLISIAKRLAQGKL